MSRTYYIVVQLESEYVSVAEALLDDSCKLFRYEDEAHEYVMSCAFSQAAIRNLPPSEIQITKYPTGEVYTVHEWTAVMREFVK